MRVRVSFLAAPWTFGLWLAAAVWADPFFFSTGDPDGRLGALTRPASPGKIETETADDFLLTEATVINGATITGLIPTGTPLANISNVEVEVYHIFPLDSDISRITEPGDVAPNVPTRTNSPADVEIDSATRDGSQGTLSFTPSLLNASFSVLNTVVNGINKKPNQKTLGEGPATGEEVEISISFTPPIFLPAGHYFFRPEVLVTGGDFLYLSAPKPIVAPGTPFTPDLQAWIRNANLAPDWLRIGTDIIDGAPPQTFNMTFSLSGETIRECVNANLLLGAATECTILQSGSLPSRPFKVDITGPGFIDGNICIGDHSSLTASGSGSVKGSIFLDPEPPAATCRSSVPGIDCSTATLKDVDTQSGACDDASAAATAKTCTIGDGTQSLSGLAGAAHTITGADGENVVCVKDVVLQAGQVITLTATSPATFVINVTGKFTINGGKIKVDGTNVKPSGVLYNVIGSGPRVGFTGGGGGVGCCKAEIDGTLIAVDRDIALSPGLINGQVCGDRNMSFVGGSSVFCPLETAE